MCKGLYITRDRKASIEFNLKDNGVFSASGTYAGGGGQCLEEIERKYPQDKVVKELTDLWRKWHLNDMNAGCEHQRKLGWGHSMDILVSPKTATSVQVEAMREPLINKKIVELMEQVGDNDKRAQDLRRQLVSDETLCFVTDVYLKALFQHVHSNKISYTQLLENWRDIATLALRKKRMVHTRQLIHPLGQEVMESIKRLAEEHPDTQFNKPIVFEDCVSAPCPECGYRYGSRWLFTPIDESDLERIKVLLKKYPTGNKSWYDIQAEDFLNKYGISLDFKQLDRMTYRVTLKREDIEVHSHYTRSIVDAEKGRDPSAYDYLACIGGDILYFEEFSCEEWIRESEDNTLDKWHSIVEELADVKKVMTEEVLEDLFEIN